MTATLPQAPPSSAAPVVPPRRGRLFVVSGPSGVGKDTVLDRLLPALPGVEKCVSATTRAPRPGETDGKDYYFISTTAFRAYEEQGAFYEYAQVSGNLYGTLAAKVEERQRAGVDVILKIDVQGGITVRRKAADAVLVFLQPPSFAELERRLRERSTETEDQINIRLVTAHKEMQAMGQYDFSVVNADVDEAADLLRAIILAERCRLPRGNGAGDNE